MSGEKQKPQSADEPPTIEKAKIFVVNARDEVLILTRSLDEDTRPGEPDLPGGKFDLGETEPFTALLREFGQELPGSRLNSIRSLYKRPRMKAGNLVVSHLFAGTAKFPEDGIALSFEHTAAAWIPRADLSEINIPYKYKLAARIFEPVFQELVELAEPQAPPHLELLAA